jgi:hypothetical protein
MIQMRICCLRIVDVEETKKEENLIDKRRMRRRNKDIGKGGRSSNRGTERQAMVVKK